METEGSPPTPLPSLKDELIANIKEWMKIESEIQKAKQELKEKNNKRKELSQKLIDVMKSHSIDCLDVKDGSLVYKKKKTKKTISAKFLLSQLESHFKDQPELAREITQKVLNSRVEVIKDELLLKI
jgi:hypothetical protein